MQGCLFGKQEASRVLRVSSALHADGSQVRRLGIYGGAGIPAGRAAVHDRLRNVCQGSSMRTAPQPGQRTSMPRPAAGPTDARPPAQALWVLAGLLFVSITLLIESAFHQEELRAKIRKADAMDGIAMRARMTNDRGGRSLRTSRSALSSAQRATVDDLLSQSSQAPLTARVRPAQQKGASCIDVQLLEPLM